MAYTLVPTELIVDGAITSAKLDTNIAISGTLGVTGELTLATHMIMGDNDKIKIGTGGDLEIYHDGSNSYISNSTGNIYLGDTNGSVHIQAKLNEESIICAADGAVTLYHDNSPKLATSSAGVTVTGALTSGAITSSGLITATSLDISGDIDVDGTTNLDVVDIDGAVNMASSLTLSTNANAISMTDATGTATRMFILNSANSTYLGPVDSYAGGEILYGASSNVTGHRMYVGAADRFNVTGSSAVFNEGSADADFRVESNDHEYKFFVDAGNNKIGIATSSPAADVHIKQIGDISNGNSQGLMLESGAGSQKFILQTGRAGVSNAYFNLRDVTNTRDIFSVIDTNGKFQGHTPLEWNNGAVFNENSQDHDFRVESNNNDYMLFVDGGNDRVGIGTSSPVTSLSLGSSSTGMSFISGDTSFNSGKIAVIKPSELGSGNGHLIFETYEGGSGGGERMRINSEGNLLINTTSKTSFPTNKGAAAFGIGGEVNLKLSSYGSAHTFQQFILAGSVVGSISATSSATAYNTSSDSRLKDVTGEARGLEVINELNPVAYNWKADGKADEGLIAQEVKEIVPNAVSGSEEEMYQMDYSKLVVHLVAGMKEQQTIIDDLKSRIETLEG